MGVEVLELEKDVEQEIHEKLDIKSMFLLGVQHVAAMCAGAIAVPMILGESLGLGVEQINTLVSATLMMAGVGTFIQTLNVHGKIGAKLPMVEGVSFAGVSALVAVGLSYRGTDSVLGLQIMFGATIVSGIFAFLVAPLFGKLLKYFPPLVSGVVVTSMGLSLIPVALRWIAGSPQTSNYLSLKNIFLALMTIGIILMVQKISKGFLGNIAILIGIFLGTLVAIPMGLADFSIINEASHFTINTPLQFGLPKFELTAVLSLFLVQLVIMTDATGNQINLSDICSVKPDEEKIVAGLRGHGLTSAIAGVFNSFPHSLFGQNVGIAAITGVKSRFVGTAAGVILLTVSFFPKLVAILTAIPSPVLGGAGIIMFGIVAANGVKRLGTVNYEKNKNLVIVATSLGMALAPISTPQLFTNFPQWGKILFQSPVTLGALTVLILNIVFNEFGKNRFWEEYKMANIKVNFAGLEYENPVIVAAGPPSKDAVAIKEAIEGGAAGVVAKTISSEAAEIPKPCMYDFKGKHFLNTELWSEMSPEHWVEEEYEKCKIKGEPLIIGLGYVKEDIKKLIPMVDKFADGYEISSHYVGRDLTPMLNTLKMAKMLTKKPVFMKVSPGVENLGDVARALETAGADGLVAINSVGPCLSIDLETGKPHMGSKNGYGWMSGAAIKPIALRVVFELAQAVKIPIFAVGGVTKGEDVIEFIMAGATAVQVCTQGIIEGPTAFGRIAKETENWLDSHGYSSLDDIRGITIKHMQNIKENNYMTIPPRVDLEKCIGCNICKTVCGYKAIEIENKKATIDIDRCFGCGVCTSKCPTKALSIPR